MKKQKKAWNKGLSKERQPTFGKHWKRKTPVWNIKPKIKIKCKVCGKIFEKCPSQAKTAKYCSYKCYGISQRKEKYPITRKYARKIAYKMLPHKCAECGNIWKLEVHHKDKNTRNNAVENLEILCTLCHKHLRHKVSEKTRKKMSKAQKLRYK